MNNRQTLQIHRCLLAIAITLLLAGTYAHPPASPEEMDLSPMAVINVSSPAE